jgi:hypothetical protein
MRGSSHTESNKQSFLPKRLASVIPRSGKKIGGGNEPKCKDTRDTVSRELGEPVIF